MKLVSSPNQRKNLVWEVLKNNFKVFEKSTAVHINLSENNDPYFKCKLYLQ